MAKVNIGDWVRIMHGGSLVIAEVRYVKNDGWKTKYIFDHHGDGDDDDILEVRSSALCIALAAEIAARERAESRVRELEDLLVKALCWEHQPVGSFESKDDATMAACGDNGYNCCSRKPWHAEARAILARDKEKSK